MRIVFFLTSSFKHSSSKAKLSACCEAHTVGVYSRGTEVLHTLQTPFTQPHRYGVRPGSPTQGTKQVSCPGPRERSYQIWVFITSHVLRGGPLRLVCPGSSKSCHAWVEARFTVHTSAELTSLLACAAVHDSEL